MLRILCLSLLLIISTSVAYADNVTLNDGSQLRIGTGSVEIRFAGAPSFTLFYTGDANPETPTAFFIHTVIHGNGTVSFNGLSTHFFTGGGSFDSNFLSGTVTAYSDQFLTSAPLFTVNFGGFGFVTLDSVGIRTFTVQAPEPTSVILLGIGLAAIAARLRSRKSGD